MQAKATFVILKKLLPRLLNGIHLDLDGLEKIKKMGDDSRKTRLVFMPIYKSYGDPLLLHFIHYLANLEQGFTFGNYEDSPKMSSIDYFVKRLGGILLRRDPQNSLSSFKSDKADPKITEYVNQSLFEEVLAHNKVTTIF